MREVEEVDREGGAEAVGLGVGGVEEVEEGFRGFERRNAVEYNVQEWGHIAEWTEWQRLFDGLRLD